MTILSCCSKPHDIQENQSVLFCPYIKTVGVSMKKKSIVTLSMKAVFLIHKGILKAL